MKHIALTSLILLMYGGVGRIPTTDPHQSSNSKPKNPPVYLKATIIASYISLSEGVSGKGHAEMFTAWIGPEASRMEFADKILLNVSQPNNGDVSYTLYPADKTFERTPHGDAPEVAIPFSPLFSRSKGMTKVRTDHYMGYKCEVMTGRFPLGTGTPLGLGMTETTAWFTTVRSHRLALRTMFSIFDSSGKLSGMFTMDVVHLEPHTKAPKRLFEVPADYKMRSLSEPDR
jgi:hypothetical protein